MPICLKKGGEREGKKSAYVETKRNNTGTVVKPRGQSCYVSQSFNYTEALRMIYESVNYGKILRDFHL